MSSKAFEYDDSLLHECATSPVVYRIVGAKEDLITKEANGSDHSCRTLQDLFMKHYKRSTPSSWVWNERFLTSVLLVHRHNSRKGKNHTLTLNQFADSNPPLSSWVDIESRNDNRIIHLNDKDSIQWAANMIASNEINRSNERLLKRLRKHRNRNELGHASLDDQMNEWKAPNLTNDRIDTLQHQDHSRPIGQIIDETSTHILDFEDSFTKSLNWATANNPDGISIVHPATDQGICGSCWAWAATGTLEASASRRKAFQAYQAATQKQQDNAVSKAQNSERNSIRIANLSVQELLDCDTAIDDGCTGGNPLLAFYFIHRYGLTSTLNYPYVGKQSICRFSKLPNPIATVEAWGLLTSNHEDNMEMVIRDVGPVAVGLNGADPTFLAYKGGIFDSVNCDQSANHAMLIVGYGQDDLDDGTVMKYWIARNSWGREWGEDGFVRVKRGNGRKNVPGVCGIAKNPSVALGGVLLAGNAGGIDHKYDYSNNHGSNNKSLEESVFYSCDSLFGFKIMETCHEIEGFLSHYRALVYCLISLITVAALVIWPLSRDCRARRQRRSRSRQHSLAVIEVDGSDSGVDSTTESDSLLRLAFPINYGSRCHSQVPNQ